MPRHTDFTCEKVVRLQSAMVCIKHNQSISKNWSTDMLKWYYKQANLPKHFFASKPYVLHPQIGNKYTETFFA